MEISAYNSTPKISGLPRWSIDKESTCQCRRHRRLGFDPWVGKILWRRKWPGKSHGLRNLLGYRPWDSKESDMAEQLSIDAHTCQRSHFGGNKCWPNPVGWLTTKGFQSLVYPNEVCKRSLRHLFNMSISNIYSQMLSETSYSEINYSVKWESTGPFLLPDAIFSQAES